MLWGPCGDFHIGYHAQNKESAKIVGIAAMSQHRSMESILLRVPSQSPGTLVHISLCNSCHITFPLGGGVAMSAVCPLNEGVTSTGCISVLSRDDVSQAACNPAYIYNIIPRWKNGRSHNSSVICTALV